MDFRLSKPSSVFLDLLRGLAAQAVVIGHGISLFGVAQIPYLQNAAVAIFFLLSGLLVPYSTFRKLDADPRYSFLSYLIDRFSRIYSGFLPAIVFVLAIDFLNQGLFPAAYRFVAAYDLRTFIGNLLMLQDHPFEETVIRIVADRFALPLTWTTAVTSFGSARSFWSVAVEWWIYLLFGWVALGNSIRRTRPVLYWTLLFFFLAVPGGNWIIERRGSGVPMMWGMGLVILALLARIPAHWFRPDAAFLSGFFTVAAALRIAFTREAYDMRFVGLVAIALFFALQHLQGQEETGLPKWIGDAITFNASFSYSLYLVHFSVMTFLVNCLGPGVANVVLSFLLSNLLAVAMYEAFEKRYRTLARSLKKAAGIAPSTLA